MSQYDFSKIRTAKTLMELKDEVEHFLLFDMKGEGEILNISDFTEYPNKQQYIVRIIKWLIDDEVFAKQRMAITFNEAFTRIRKDILWT